jgi:sulfiredoxin
MKTYAIPVEKLYVPVKKRQEVEQDKVDTLAEDIIENGLKVPIQVRKDEAKSRLVLVEGAHRLEAYRALGEEHIPGIIVQAKKF